LDGTATHTGHIVIFSRPAVPRPSGSGIRIKVAGYAFSSHAAMSRPELAPDLRRFVVTNIPSVPFLEAVLLLRADPAREWTPQDMAQRLYISAEQAHPLLESIAQGQIAVRSGNEPPRFRWGPGSPDIARMLDRLAAHYAGDVVTIATLIHGKTDMRAQKFADAFRWRKDS
jgi:hypothetical protein